MKFALVNGERMEPQPKLRGVCPCCDSEMVAKCGRVVIWHWAHLPSGNCDPWWGGETDWHREWKNRFPVDWQEVVHIDDRTGERHIADIKTPHGLVIEFQHSTMTFEEMVSREAFYQNMIWVVDGDRGSTDPGTFNVGLSRREPLLFRPLVLGAKWWGRSRLLHRWADANAPVYIDVGWNGLWLFLQFLPEDAVGAFSPLHPDWLVEACSNGEPVPVRHVPEEEEEGWASQQFMVELDLAGGFGAAKADQARERL